MPKSRKKRGKRKSFGELFKISNCMNPETSSPESDDTVQNEQDNTDLVGNCKEVQSTKDIGEISTDKRYSDEYITDTPEYDTELADQKRKEDDGYFTNIPEESNLDEKNIYGSDEFTRQSFELSTFDFDQRRCVSHDIGITSYKEDDTISIGGCSLLEKDEEDTTSNDEQNDATSNKKEDTIFIGACSLLEKDEQIDTQSDKKDYIISTGECSQSIKDEQLDTSSDKKDDNRSIGAGSKSDVDETVDHTTDKNDEISSIGACSLSDTDEQIDATTDKTDDTPSIGACFLPDIDEQIDATTDKIDDTPSIGACSLSGTDGQIDATTDKIDDTPSIGACSLPDIDEQIDATTDKIDDTPSIGACSLPGTDGQIDATTDKIDDTPSIGACSLPGTDGQIDATTDKIDDTPSIGACSLSDTDEQIDATTDKIDDTPSIGACSLPGTDGQIDATTDKIDDTPSIGACSLSDTDEQIDATTDKIDDTPSIGACSLPGTDGQIDATTDKIDDTPSIGACSLPGTDGQIDATTDKIDDTPSIGACSLSDTDEQIDATTDKIDDTPSIGACSLPGTDGQIDATTDKIDDTPSIGACSLSDTDEQIDATTDKIDDTPSIGACSLPDIDEQIDATTDKIDDTPSIGACFLSDTDEQIDATTDKKDDTPPIGACSLSDTDEQIDVTTDKKDDAPSIDVTTDKKDDAPSIGIGACSQSDTDGQKRLNPIVEEDEPENSKGSGKQKDVKDLSPSLYIDPMVLDSQREILLNLKNLIEQNVKQIKEMRKNKAQLNLAFLKEELRHERSEKDVKEMKDKLTTLRDDFWDEAKNFPAEVSLKTDKLGNAKVKNKQELVDQLNAMKRKEKLLKEVIPKLKRENALKKTWSPTESAIKFSPVIEQLNVQFLAEFGTRFEFKQLKPGIYYRDPFSRTTYHVAEDKIEDFKTNHPYLYHNCQRFIKGEDVENYNQKTAEDNELKETNHDLKETKENDVEKQISEIENNTTEANKRKIMTNGTGLKMEHYDGNNLTNEDTMVFNDIAGSKTQIVRRKTDKETPKKHELKKGGAVAIVPTKSQTLIAQNVKKPIVESKIDDGKSKPRRKIASKIPKPISSHGNKIKIDATRYSREMSPHKKNKENNDQKNAKVDTNILERVEKLRELGKDVYVKTTGDKSFIYIKPAASQDNETGYDPVKRKSRLSATTVSKESNPVIGQVTVYRTPPVSRRNYTAKESIVSTNQTNIENVSPLDNMEFRVHAKPVVVIGKTKIPLFIRNTMANKTPAPRRKPNISVPSPRVKLEEGQLKHSEIEMKGYTSRSEPTITDAMNKEVKTGRDIFNVDKETLVSMEKPNKGSVTSPTRTFNQRPKVLRKSLIPISIRYIKEKGQNNEVEKESTPYIHIIAKVIDAYITTETAENKTFDNPKVGEKKDTNNHHDIIAVRAKDKYRRKEILTKDKVENEKISTIEEGNGIRKTSKNVAIPPPIKSTKEILKTKDKVENKRSSTLDEGDAIMKKSKNVVILPPIKSTKEILKTKDKVENKRSSTHDEGDAIMKKSKNVLILPPIKSTSPTKRARSRSERCPSYKPNKNNERNDDSSLCVNVGSTMNGRNSVSDTGTLNLMLDKNSSGKLNEERCRVWPHPPVEKNENDLKLPHSPESERVRRNNRARRNVRIPKGIEMDNIAEMFNSKTNGKSSEALEMRLQSTTTNDRDSFYDLSRSSTTFGQQTNIKKNSTGFETSVNTCRGKLLENIDEKMLSSVIREQCNSDSKSSRVFLPPIRNH